LTSAVIDLRMMYRNFMKAFYRRERNEKITGSHIDYEDGHFKEKSI